MGCTSSDIRRASGVMSLWRKDIGCVRYVVRPNNANRKRRRGAGLMLLGGDTLCGQMPNAKPSKSVENLNLPESNAGKRGT